MNYVVSKFTGLTGDKKAVTALEYALIAGAIAVVIVTIVTNLGSQVSGVFSTISSGL